MNKGIAQSIRVKCLKRDRKSFLADPIKLEIKSVKMLTSRNIYEERVI